MSFRTSEWIVLIYFAYLAGVAMGVSVLPRRRWRVIAIAALVVTSVSIIALLGDEGFGSVLRDWMPLMYILLGYWLPALVAKAPNEALERALLKVDHTWFGPEGIRNVAERSPIIVLDAFELAYLFCYPLVPLGFACLYLAGFRDESNRFWTAVLLAVLPCYGVLPWLPTRPPRSIEVSSSAREPRIRLLNLRVLARASVQFNTFPSGHVAAAVATALAVGVRLPAAGIALGLIALGISVGSVIGRYHYAVDTLTGSALAVAGFIASRFA